MELVIKIKEGFTLKDCALAIQQLNVAMAPLLVNGPIPVNPEAEQQELLIGDACTLPNEFGYVRIRLNSYRKLILPQLPATTPFDIVLGEPVEDVVTETGVVDAAPIITQVYTGTFV